MSTQTERFFSRKSFGRYGHGMRLNQVNFMALSSVSRRDRIKVTMFWRDLLTPGTLRAVLRSRRERTLYPKLVAQSGCYDIGLGGECFE
jgi:hypothetical protein